MAVIILMAFMLNKKDVAPEDWVVSYISDVSAKFPEKPKFESFDNTTEGGSSIVSMQSLQFKATAYVLKQTQYPGENFAKYTDDERKNIVHNFIADFAGKVGANSRTIASEEVTVDGLRCFDALIHSNMNGVDISVYVRMFIYNNNVYTATVTTYGSEDIDTMWEIAFPFISSINTP